MDNKQIAKEVIAALGGRDNVKSVAHCATRLRVMVVDEAKIDKEKAENIEKVKGAFFNSGQYQLIFGTGTVNKIYDEVVALGLPTATTGEQKAEAAAQGNAFQRAIRTFGDVFVPIIPAIVATGLFMGFRGLLTRPEIMELLGVTAYNADFITYTQILTDTAFIILPALVVWSTFRVFGGNQTIGFVLGSMLIAGQLPNAWAVASGGEVEAMKFFGAIPVVGLQGSVLPAFIIGVVGAKFEKAVRKVVPEVLDLLLTPFITLLVMSAVGLFAIGPVFHVVEEYILDATTALLSLPFGLGGLIIGGTQQIIVVSGVHHIFNLLEINLLSEYGHNAFNAIITAAMTAQGAATVAVGVKTKDAKLKALAFPAALAAFLGITEPAIFGVNLRYRKPFFLSLGAGALGGMLASLLGLAGTGSGVTIIPGTLLYLDGQLFKYLLMVAVSFALGFALTYFFGFEDEEPVGGDELTRTLAKATIAGAAGLAYVESKEAKKTSASAVSGQTPVAEATSERVQPKVSAVPASTEGTLLSPLAGQTVTLSSVNDPVFSSGAMGQGIAIKPSANTVYAPADGRISVAFETGHAYGIETTQGAEVLIHIGIDTVSMAGNGFTAHVKTGQTVKAGDVLATFDPAKIAAAGLDDTTMIIVTNTDRYAHVTPLAHGQVTVGQALIGLS